MATDTADANPLRAALRIGRARVSQVARPHSDALREIVVAGLAALAYFGVRNLTAGSEATAFANARRLMRFEDTTHLDWERWLQARVVASATLSDLGNWVYIWGHWPVIISVGIILFLHRRERYRLLRNAILVSGGVGFLFFALFPVAPPRLVDPTLVDTVTLHSHAYRALQPPGLTDQYAAFPSLHFGWNLLAGVAVWGATRNVAARTLAVLGPAAMAAAVIVTANHYVVDVFAGLVVVLVGLVAHRLIVSLELQSKVNRVWARLPGGQRPDPPSPSPTGRRTTVCALSPRRRRRFAAISEARTAAIGSARRSGHPVRPRFPGR
jgi:membrane-associated phospholipid phosphatase